MGNGQSNESLGPAQLDLISQSLARQGHSDLIVTAPSGEQRLRRDARQEIQSQLITSTDDSSDHSISHSSLDLPTMAQPTQKLDIAAVVAIIEDLKKHASPEDLIMLHRAILSATQDTPLSSPIAESEKKMSRRRSFFTPGIATRDKKNKKSPASKKLQTQTWSPEMFGASPLSRIENMSPSALLAAGQDRSTTPDLSYLGAHQLGSLRVTNGAVTPEPSIFGDRPHTGESIPSSHNENYYTASEGSGRDSPEKGLTIDTLMQQDSWQHPEDCDTPKGPTYFRPQIPSYRIPAVQVQDVDQEEEVSFASSVESGLSGVSYDVGADVEEAVDDEENLRVDFSPLERPLSALKLYTFEASSNPFLVSPDAEPHSGVSSPLESSLEGATRADQTEESYFSGVTPQHDHREQSDESDVSSLGVPLRCPSRPPPPPPIAAGTEDTHDAYLAETYAGDDVDDYAVEDEYDCDNQQDTNQQLEVTSKPAYEESIYSDYVTPSDAIHPRDSYRTQDQLCSFTSPRHLHGIALSASSSVYSNKPHSHTADVAVEKSLSRSKVDSGYGSQNSVRTLKSAGDDERLADVQESPVHESIEEEEQRQEQDSILREASPSRYPEPTLPSIQPHPETEPSQTAAPFKAHLNQRYDGAFPPIPPRSPSRPRPEQRYSTPNLLSMTSVMPSIPLVGSEGDNLPSLITPKKLKKKKRPVSDMYSAPTPLIVQTSVFETTAFSSLPRVPSVIASRYRDRLSRTPGMEHLERTFKSTSHSDSRESLCSTEIPAVSIRFPSPTRKFLPSNELSKPTTPTTPTVERGRKSRKSEGASERKGFFRSRSRKSRERKRSVSFSPEPEGPPLALAGVADFGTVAASLGSSPYDFAMSAGPATRNAQGELREPGAVTHPHQIGTGMLKKRIGMDDKQAAALALQRSRDKPEGLDIQNTPALPRPMFNSHSRSKSQHEGGPADPLKRRQLQSHMSVPANHSLTLQHRQPEGEEGADWEQSAQVWWVRRKPIGEGLLQSTVQGGRIDNMAAWSRLTRQASEEMHPLHLEDEILPQQNARTKSPTPSVLERAAAWESGQCSRESSPIRTMPPRPTRRAPSPPKQQQPAWVEGPTMESGRVAISKFSVAPNASNANCVARRERYYG